MKRTTIWFALILGAATLAACAETPAELTCARVAITQASGSEAREGSPADIERARAAVREADQCIENGCNVDVARDLAYVASRRVQRAETEARIAEQVRVQQDAYRRHVDATQRARMPQPEGGGGVAQSPNATPAPVMVR